MDEQKNEKLNQAPKAPGLSREEIAEIMARILGKDVKKRPAADGIPAVLAATVGQYAGTLILSSPNRLKSRKLWAMIGTVAVLLSQAPLGYQLSPVTQWIIGAVAAVYISTQGIVDIAATPKPLEPAA